MGIRLDIHVVLFTTARAHSSVIETTFVPNTTIVTCSVQSLNVVRPHNRGLGLVPYQSIVRLKELIFNVELLSFSYVID